MRKEKAKNMEITHAITGALALICLVLTYLCRRLARNTDNTGIRDYVFSLERSNQDLSKWIYDLEKVVDQVGELLDHIGVNLERSSFQHLVFPLRATFCLQVTRNRM